ncbi:MAG TPA: hypothetical protein VG826_30775 [Pirellulales bacterium]|nr:hypothetical protein [Pirellulales bacterium]
MFFASLVAAGFQLVCAAGVFAIARTGTAGRVVVASVAGLIGIGLSAINGVLLFQGLLLAAIGIACTCGGARQRVFAGLAAAASVGILGIAGWAGVRSWHGLKNRYPFESMSSRLAYEESHSRLAGLDSPTPSESTRYRLKKAGEWNSWSARNHALELVHASYVEQFIASPGFGVGRMIRPAPYHIESGDRRADTVYPLDLPPDLDGSSEDAEDVSVEREPRLSAKFLGLLNALHNDARHDFLSPDGFGYFRDRDHVAGFVPHGFLNDQPALHTGGRDTQWLTVRVNLVSLLKHERPMAYVSKHLPNMTELRDAPVRELDEFEQRALSSLFEGEDMVSDVHPNRVRAVGSLRAARQCLDCHQVERETLLGAFSYEFLRDPPVRRLPEHRPDGDEKLL